MLITSAKIEISITSAKTEMLITSAIFAKYGRITTFVFEALKVEIGWAEEIVHFFSQ